MLFSPVLLAQSADEGEKKVKIKIQENNNGTKTEKEETLIIDENTDVETLLRDLGFDSELGELKGKEILEIKITRKTEGNEVKEERQIKIEDEEEAEEVLLEEVEEKETPKVDPKRPMLGLYFEPRGNGAYVTSIINQSAASISGFAPGDFIESVNGEKVNATTDLRELIAKYKAGDKVGIRFMRDGKVRYKEVVLGEWEDHYIDRRDFNWEELDLGDFKFEFDHERGRGSHYKETPFLGVRPAESAADIAGDKGVQIEKVIPGSTAEKIGLASGDRIVEYNGISISDMNSLIAAVKDSEVGSQTSVKAVRDGQIREFTGELGMRHSKTKERRFRNTPSNSDLQNKIKELERQIDVLEERFGSGFADDARMSLEKIQNELDTKNGSSNDNFRSVTFQLSVEMTEVSEGEAWDLNKRNPSAGLKNSNSLELDRLSFAPNPNNGKFKLAFETQDPGIYTIKVMDISGQLIHHKKSQIQRLFAETIDLSDKPDGTYFINISKDNKSYSRKIVIAK